MAFYLITTTYLIILMHYQTISYLQPKHNLNNLNNLSNLNNNPL